MDWIKRFWASVVEHYRWFDTAWMPITEEDMEAYEDDPSRDEFGLSPPRTHTDRR